MDAWTLHNSDCLDPVTGLASLADNSIDVAIFDPPYSEHVHAKSRAGATPRNAAIDPTGRTFSIRRDFGFESLTDDVRAGVARECARLVRRWVLAFTDPEGAHLWRRDFEAAGLEYIREGAWIKLNGSPQFTGDRPAAGHEAIVIAHRPGRKRWNGGGRHGLWSYPVVMDRGGADNVAEQRIHTAQKPLALMEALTRDFTDFGDLILDPFAGSATGGVAAVRLGRRWVGWERNPEWHAAAVKRLAKTREQGDIFARVKQQRVTTESLFPAPEKETA